MSEPVAKTLVSKAGDGKPDVDPTCGTCRFWRPAAKTPRDRAGFAAVRGGECRRRAPLLVLVQKDWKDMANVETGRFPVVDRADWCGEWEGMK